MGLRRAMSVTPSLQNSFVLPSPTHPDEAGRSLAPAKILFFTASLGNGGAEMHLLRVINALDRTHFAPSLALAQRGGAYETAIAPDTPLHGLNPPGVKSSTVRMVRAIAPLRQLIATEQPDLVCSVLDHANLAAVLACRGLKTRPKLLLSVQNSPYAQYHRAWHPMDRGLMVLMARLYPEGDRIIALSQGVADEFQTLLGAKCPPISVIYNAGLDERVEQGAQAVHLADDAPHATPLIVACGRLHDQKGFPDLLRAMAKVRQQVPARLWIVGEGPQRPLLERMIRQLGLTDAVQLLGFQPNPYQYMAAADVFVLSSRYEGFGNVVVEAMACGTPVVSTDCNHGPAEILEQGKHGILVPPGDPEALAKQLVRVLTHPQLRERLARQGLARSRHFHASAIAQHYGDLFHDVLT